MISPHRLLGYLVSLTGILILCCALNGFITANELHHLAELGLPASTLASSPYPGYNLALVEDVLANAVLKLFLAGGLLGIGAVCAWREGA